jgi:putative hydrolase of the HAD superfamily
VPITELVLDLDNTLYPADRGVVERVDAAIVRFMTDDLGMELAVAHETRARYRDAYGTTLHGLMRHHDVDPDAYLARIHAIEIDDVLAPDAALRALLEALPQRKSVLTNGAAVHATRVLDRLGLRPCFAEVFSLERTAYVPKPEPGAFRTVLAALGAAPGDCLFADDRPDNCRTARALGMRTALVGPTGGGGDAAIDVRIASIHELPAALAAVTP